MDFRPLTIADRALFEERLAGREYRLGTYDFNNLFMWRDWDPYLVCELGNTLIVRSDFRETPAYLVPITPDDGQLLAATEQLIDWCRRHDQPFFMAEVCEGARLLLERTWPERFVFEEFPAGANYVYYQKDLATLTGHKYNSKRNHLRQFERACPGWELALIDKNNVEACRELEWKWFNGHIIRPDVEREHRGVLDALHYLDQLSCTGAVLLWQGRAVAFTVGGRLNSDTVSIHIEKADPDVPGSFQAINCFYAREYCGWATYINRAEDMGDPGLRRAKESYHPCRMEKKFFMKLK
ncbi:MAG: DUF2156 domain-containing protein [Firmicutes bacterium]|nr:DUF2156 domain-containing protein [Bacillota bacterium]